MEFFFIMLLWWKKHCCSILSEIEPSAKISVTLLGYLYSGKSDTQQCSKNSYIFPTNSDFFEAMGFEEQIFQFTSHHKSWSDINQHTKMKKE